MKKRLPNHLYPGKPRYIGPTVGYFTLLHHQGPIVEFSHNVKERIHFIKTQKLHEERPIRLRHIVYVPDRLLPYKVRRAAAALKAALSRLTLARAKVDKMSHESGHVPTSLLHTHNQARAIVRFHTNEVINLNSRYLQHGEAKKRLTKYLGRYVRRGYRWDSHINSLRF